MKQKRPVNLDLMSLKYPPMAIASILHRLSGIVLFLLSPALLYLLSLSLHSRTSFEHMKHLIAAPFNKFLLWVFAAALAYHLLAGIRHMIMDLGFAEGLPTGRRTALLVILLAIFAMIILGIWIW
ncbi:succinate dehydrogenase, cytochrome b556 subunit [Legionella impletisoli]|uniref:Succinate dehydrogenase cytochrome b556 subunit n=1 Tax=Legionella impletisoli TaxID=343510 RepID=A0A917ND75_9GAMM|nr:succinate dehydrogenase, cytochrome b556 subunit [Legionella impletisoli]GGI88958.1 succinate dehydrogenase, cytochrome b556 subunit [Legionella impletisoli]